MDRNVIIRQRKLIREKVERVKKMTSIYFDGKSNDTLTSTGKLESQDHICILSEPGSKYVAHTPAASKAAEVQTNAILARLSDVDLTEMEAVGSDGKLYYSYTTYFLNRYAYFTSTSYH